MKMASVELRGAEVNAWKEILSHGCSIKKNT
jgi:hypothetical protein